MSLKSINSRKQRYKQHVMKQQQARNAASIFRYMT